MEIVPFYEDFGEIAEKETRCLIFPGGKQGALASRYAMVESYCNDKKCDCRRVFINVLHEETNQILATIGFGWGMLSSIKSGRVIRKMEFMRKVQSMKWGVTNPSMHQYPWDCSKRYSLMTLSLSSA